MASHTDTTARARASECGLYRLPPTATCSFPRSGGCTTYITRSINRVLGTKKNPNRSAHKHSGEEGRGEGEGGERWVRVCCWYS